MTTHHSHERVPALTLGWRLKMALGERSADEMAAHLGVSRQTVSRWMNDHGAAPKRAYIIQWALATKTSAEWLETGKVTGGGGGGGLQIGRDTRKMGPSQYTAGNIDRLVA